VERNADSSTGVWFVIISHGSLILSPILSFFDTEQIGSDITSGYKTLTDALVGIEKMHKELRYLTEKVVKAEVHHNLAQSFVLAC
jgi:hypothetical protein